CAPIRASHAHGVDRTVGPIMRGGSLSSARVMVPPRDILDYLVAELRVGARAPEDVLTHFRDAWLWDEASASQLRTDIREAHDVGRLTDAEAGDLSRGVETWLMSMSDDEP